MPLVVDLDYYLEVNGIALACAAWHVTDLGPLLDDPNVRGEDRLIPSMDGRRGYRRRVDATVYTFPFEIIGGYNSDGTRRADPAAGVFVHLDYLRANLGLASATGNGTVPMIFHRGSASSLTADGHFLGFKGSKWLNPGLMLTTFDISIPAGRFS